MLIDSTSDVLKDYLASFKHWRIWYFWGKQDVKGRFRKSFFGGAWVVIHLLVWSISAALIYGQLFGQDVSHFMPYVLVGFSIWGLLSNSLSEGGNAFLSAEGYIKQIPFPYGVYILRNFTSHVLNFIGLIPVLLIVYIALGRDLSWVMLWGGVGLLFVFLICFLHIVIVAHLTLYIRDLPHAIGSLMQPLFFITPLIYVKADIPEKWAWVYEWNIFYYLVEVVRLPLVEYKTVPATHFMVLGGYFFVLLIIAFAVTKRVRPQISYKL